MHPFLFHIGPIPIYTYGFFVALGVLLAIFCMKRACRKEGWKPDEILDLVLWFTLASFLGARVFYVVQHWDYYLSNPVEIFQIWEGGIVFYGGAIGGLLFLVFFARKKGWPYFQVTDFLAPYVFLAHGFGRIGCFFNGCCYGKETHLPWAVRYPFLPNPVHPAQIYSSIFNFSAFLFLAALHQRKKFHGETTLAYLIVYGAGRFVLERFRGDNPIFLFGCTLPQVISIGFILFASLSYFVYFRHIPPVRVNEETRNPS